MSNENNPFNILGSESTPVNQGEQVQEANTENELTVRIKSLINSAPVFLFMKGSPEFPQCGFSANVIGLLNHVGVAFKTFDILSDQDIRQGVKEHSNWPTYPQLYVKGQMVGGNDIIMEMYEAGELQDVLNA
jgi:monothiol glutaredoxin